MNAARQLAAYLLTYFPASVLRLAELEEVAIQLDKKPWLKPTVRRLVAGRAEGSAIRGLEDGGPTGNARS